jgi:hypothetical protein
VSQRDTEISLTALEVEIFNHLMYHIEELKGPFRIFVDTVYSKENDQ